MAKTLNVAGRTGEVRGGGAEAKCPADVLRRPARRPAAEAAGARASRKRFL